MSRSPTPCIGPTAEEVAYFKGLLEAFEAAEKAGLGAVSYQGAMVDYAMLPLAREVTRRGRAEQLGCLAKPTPEKTCPPMP